MSFINHFFNNRSNPANKVKWRDKKKSKEITEIPIKEALIDNLTSNISERGIDWCKWNLLYKEYNESTIDGKIGFVQWLMENCEISKKKI